MALGIITVSKRRYAAGLFWQPAMQRIGVRENATQISKSAKLKASLFVSFGGMIGVIGRMGGARAGMPVAAAEVMDSFGEQTFLAAFNVKEGVWLMASRGGIIIKDQVYKNLDDAKRAYAQLNLMPDWNLLVAPATWNAPSAVERRLDEFIKKHSKHRLHNISHLPAYVMTAGFVMAAAVLGYGLFEESIRQTMAPRVHNLDIEPELIDEFQRRMEEIDAPPPRPDPTVVHVPMPWESLPDLHERADQCHRAIAFLAQQITGWVVNSITCEKKIAHAHLIRSFGTIGDLYGTVANIMPSVRVNETGGSDVILSANLPPLATRYDAPAHTASEIMTAVKSVFQRINDQIEFRRELYDLNIPDISEDEVLDTSLRSVPMVQLAVTTKLQPREFIKIMDDIQGIEMPVVKWDAGARDWIYDVRIFVK